MLFLLAIALRLSLYHVVTSDYTVFLSQWYDYIQTHGGFSSSSLTLNAPSFYQWLPASAPEYWKWVGILLAVMVVVLIGVLIVASKKKITSTIILKVALVFALAIPFLLPEMHERYFYLADVISIIYAFYFPRYFFIAIIMQLCSLLSYAPYLLHTQIVNLAYVAFAVLVITVITMTDLVLTLALHIKSPLHTKSGVRTEYRLEV